MDTVRKAAILAIPEVTYGVDPVPTGASNAILVEDQTIERISKTTEVNYTRPTYGSSLPYNIGEGLKITFKTRPRGPGVGLEGAAPKDGVLYRACNLTEILDPGVSAEYLPNSLDTDAESATIYFHIGGRLHKALGARGTLKPALEVNAPGMIDWEFTALYAGPIDSALPTPVYDDVRPPVFRNASFLIDTYAAVIEKFAIDIGNKVTRRPDANHANGVREFFIGDRKVIGNIDPEATTAAEKDFWAMLDDGTRGALTCTLGSTAGNRLVITAPKVGLADLTYGTREEILTYETPLSFDPDTGDDEISFLFN